MDHTRVTLWTCAAWQTKSETEVITEIDCSLCVPPTCGLSGTSTNLCEFLSGTALRALGNRLKYELLQWRDTESKDIKKEKVLALLLIGHV